MGDRLLCKFCTHYHSGTCDADEVCPIYVGEDCDSFENRYDKTISTDDGFCPSVQDPDQDDLGKACGVMGFLMGLGKLK